MKLNFNQAVVSKEYQNGYEAGYKLGSEYAQDVITNMYLSMKNTNEDKTSEYVKGILDGYDTGYQQTQYEANLININGTLFELVICKCGWKYIIVTKEFIEALNCGWIGKHYWNERIGCWAFYNNILEPFSWLASKKPNYCLNDNCNQGQ